MQIINAIFQFSTGLFIACGKLFLSVLCLICVCIVPWAIISTIIEEITGKRKEKP